MGVFHSRLGLANPAKAAQRRPALSDQRLLELCQDRLPTGKERIAFRKIRERRFRAHRARRAFQRRAYWGFTAFSISSQILTQALSRRAGVMAAKGLLGSRTAA